METLGSRFGTCPCGGVFDDRVVAITLRPGDDEPQTIEDVHQGVCPVCGGRVYKAATLELIEAGYRRISRASGSG